MVGLQSTIWLAKWCPTANYCSGLTINSMASEMSPHHLLLWWSYIQLYGKQNGAPPLITVVGLQSTIWLAKCCPTANYCGGLTINCMAIEMVPHHLLLWWSYIQLYG